MGLQDIVLPRREFAPVPELHVGPMFASKTSDGIISFIDTHGVYAHQNWLVFKPVIDDRFIVDRVLTHRDRKYAALFADQLKDLGFSDTEIKKQRALYESKLGVPAIPVTHASDIYSEVERYLSSHGSLNAVAIDEANLFDEGLIPLVKNLSQRGIHVSLAGLDRDYRGELWYLRKEGTDFKRIEHIGFNVYEFERSTHPFMELATFCELFKHHARCTPLGRKCGQEASLTIRYEHGKPSDYFGPTIAFGDENDTENNPYRYGSVCPDDHLVANKPLCELEKSFKDRSSIVLQRTAAGK